MYTTALPTGIGGRLLPVVQRALVIPAVRHSLERQATRTAAANGAGVPHSEASARVSNRNGQVVEACVETGDGYTFTAGLPGLSRGRTECELALSAGDR